MRRLNIAYSLVSVLVAAALQFGGSARYLSPFAQRGTVKRDKSSRPPRGRAAIVWGPAYGRRGGGLNCKNVQGGGPVALSRQHLYLSSYARNMTEYLNGIYG